MSKKGLITGLRKLNKHYGMKIRYRTGFPDNGNYSPCADWQRKEVIIPNDSAFQNLYCVAHEYSHLVCAQSGYIFGYEDHNHRSFAKVNKQVCKILGIEYIPLPKLLKGVYSNLSGEHKQLVALESSEMRKLLFKDLKAKK